TPSPRIFQDKDKINVNVNILSERNSVSKEKSSVGSGTRGGHRGAAGHTAPMLPLLLLLLLPASMLGWGC
ncbi:unnamed protein product, partial [Coregonus sp. 'balchen']